MRGRFRRCCLPTALRLRLASRYGGTVGNPIHNNDAEDGRSPKFVPAILHCPDPIELETPDSQCLLIPL
jgi:hypothetical protein